MSGGSISGNPAEYALQQKEFDFQLSQYNLLIEINQTLIKILMILEEMTEEEL